MIHRFFQTLMKNTNYEQILSMISQQKKIDFYSKNYETFLSTQDQLLSLKLPQLKQIPKAKQFHLKLKQQQKVQQNIDQASVIQIIDSFSTHVLQKNYEQVLRMYKIILQMKQHTKYKQYFYSYSINKIFRQSYISFVENCNDVEMLIGLKEQVQAIKVYFRKKENQIFQKINTDLKIDSSVYSLKKSLSYLLHQIQQFSQDFKAKFRKSLEKQTQLSIYLSKWIHDLSKTYYQTVQSFIYQNQQISIILKSFGQILQSSTEIQSKGISLYRQLRNHISQDLPLHLQKIIQVVLQSFDDILKYNNEMYQFVQFKSLNSIQQLINQLRPIDKNKKGYQKKCASQKGILLINSFLMILVPLCDDKWAFLHQNILQSIIDKVKGMIEGQKIKLPLWDYYHLFNFFYNLKDGKVKHKILFDPNNASYLKQKIVKIKKIADECRYIFQNNLITDFWTGILSNIPEQLWQFKKYAQSYQKSQPKPTVFSIWLIFQLEQFCKQIRYRISKQHYQYIGIQFYEYILFVIEYIIFWAYHQKGKNQKVFILYQKQQKLLLKAKQVFSIQQLHCVKNKQILKLQNFTKFGLERFVVDIYFMTDVYRILFNNTQKVKADKFLAKVAKILSKQLKNQPLQTDRKKYDELLKNFSNVYIKSPQTIRKYLNQRKKGGSRLQSLSSLQSSGSTSKNRS